MIDRYTDPGLQPNDFFEAINKIQLTYLYRLTSRLTNHGLPPHCQDLSVSRNAMNTAFNLKADNEDVDE